MKPVYPETGSVKKPVHCCRLLPSYSFLTPSKTITCYTAPKSIQISEMKPVYAMTISPGTISKNKFFFSVPKQVVSTNFFSKNCEF